jgi:hypothetical protein
MGDSLPPVNLGAGRTAVALAAGTSNHTCARLDNGQLKCWGYNFFGQLGLGDVFNRGDIGIGMGDMLLPVDLGAIVPATLGVTQQPSNANVGQPLPVQPIVTIRDAGSATVVNDNSTQVTLALQGGVGVLTCTGGNTKTAVNGVVTFAGCAVSAAGAFTLLAISTPLPPVSTNSFVISAVATKLAFTKQPSNATVAQALQSQPVVAIQDSGSGTVISDNTTQVTLVLQGGAGVLTCTGGTTKTAVTGLATFAGCSVSAAGTYTLLATSNPALTLPSSASFVISAAASACSGPVVINLALGATGEIFCGAQLQLTTPLPPGPLPDVVTAIFSWSNAFQRFDFWFRGFPNTFQTLGNISPGEFYFFQSTGPGQIANTGGALRAESRAMSIGPTTAGANGAVWSGEPHSLDALDSCANITPVTAIFSWDNAAQQFNFWFRGFPDNFQTLTAGVERGKYYFFQTPAGQTIAMD